MFSSVHKKHYTDLACASNGLLVLDNKTEQQARFFPRVSNLIVLVEKLSKKPTTLGIFNQKSKIVSFLRSTHAHPWSRNEITNQISR